MNKKIVFIIALVLAPLVLLPLISFFTDSLYSQYWDNKRVSAQVEQSKPAKKQIIDTPSKPAYTSDGFDWSLPANTPVEENSGLIDEYDRGLDFAQNIFAIVRWDDANPSKGHYDFSRFEKHLASVSPKKTLVRLEVNSACEAPKWALKTLKRSPDKSLIFWDSNYVDLLKPFVKAFATRYANDPRVIGVQLGIADGEYRGDSCDFSNKDGWGEFWMSPEAIAIAQKEYGFNPDIFEKQTKAIIDIYVSAFGQNKAKLAFTNIAPSFSWNEIADPYNERLKRIAQHVWRSGVGNRDGHIEIWMRFIDKAFGVQLSSMSDGTCYLGFDEAYATEIRGRYWGTENEFYGDKGYVIGDNGPYKNQPYRFLISSLRALQMRRNYFSIAGDSMAIMKDPVYKTQDFLEYLNKVMGKQIENTPDAFILLGERYISKDHAKNFENESCVKESKKGVAVRSFGRWLTEKSHSKPALPVSMPANENYWGQDFYMPEGVDFEYSARESKQFEFDINDQLTIKRCQNGCDTEVKITYADTAVTTLTIGYDDNKFQRFKTNGDNKIKTLTFSVNSRFQNNFKGTDFIISSETTVPLTLIRVNFL